MSWYKSAHAKPIGSMYACVRGFTSPIANVEIAVNITPNYHQRQHQMTSHTLKNGTNIIIHRPAAEISGDHQTYANNPFEKITDINNNPRIYLPLALPTLLRGQVPKCRKQNSRGGMSHPNNCKKTQ